MRPPVKRIDRASQGTKSRLSTRDTEEQTGRRIIRRPVDVQADVYLVLSLTVGGPFTTLSISESNFAAMAVPAGYGFFPAKERP